MCTAATYKGEDFYFGRTLDNGFSYGEKIVITPRHYVFDFREEKEITTHYAIIGMAYVSNDYPLYYDAINEKGLGMAGLNFVHNAYYGEKEEGKNNIAQFEFIPWILSQCKTVKEARTLMENIKIINTPFSIDLPASELHWIIADKNESIVVESIKEGIKVYDNPVGVLTNNPTFDKQMLNLKKYESLTNKQPQVNYDKSLFSLGLGALTLPGDLSSQSRFVRASFVKMNSVSLPNEKESVSQFFHILGSVDQQRGCCQLDNGNYEITIYTSCCNSTKGIYYYKTYDNHQIVGIDMHKENLNTSNLIVYPLLESNEPLIQN